MASNALIVTVWSSAQHFLSTAVGCTSILYRFCSFWHHTEFLLQSHPGKVEGQPSHTHKGRPAPVVLLVAFCERRYTINGTTKVTLEGKSK
jgi:hypothetical protein